MSGNTPEVVAELFQKAPQSEASVLQRLIIKFLAESDFEDLVQLLRMGYATGMFGMDLSPAQSESLPYILQVAPLHTTDLQSGSTLSHGTTDYTKFFINGSQTTISIKTLL